MGNDIGPDGSASHLCYSAGSRTEIFPLAVDFAPLSRVDWFQFLLGL